MDVNKLLFMLSNTCGVSGNESGVAGVLLGILKEYTDDCYISNGNVIGNFGNRTDDKPHVLIDAHMDEIGMICSYIDDSGFIIPGNIGGMDYRLLPAQKVIIHGKEEVKGIISAIPPHLTTNGGPVTEIENVRIDTGYSKKELSDKVPLGSTISYDVECKSLINGCVTGKSLDNRISAAAILMMLDNLIGKKYCCSFSVLFSTTEEIGGRGAKTACYAINPDIAIAVDTSFALTADDKPCKCGKLGSGPMIGVSPSLSAEISDMLVNISKQKDIPYQTEIMSGLTGTNADHFGICRCGVKTCTCSIPIKYMHTPVELSCTEDIDNTSLLLSEFIRAVK